MWFDTAKKYVAIPITIALACTAILSGTALNASAAEERPVEDSVAFDMGPRLPIVETMIGEGSLSSGRVELPGVERYSSALVRISVFDAAVDAMIGVGGFDALWVHAGHDASTTVLAPIDNGGISITADQKLNVRVEVLSLFEGADNAPGATNALATPVVRADGSLDAGSNTVGIVGLGGVPSEDVRAAYVTLSFALNTPGSVMVDSQTMQLPQGNSVVTTVVTPDPKDGTITMASEASGSMKFAVRGWVQGSKQLDAKANVDGGFVPSALHKGLDARVKEGGDTALSIGRMADAQASLALVSADAPASQGFGYIYADGRTQGRAHGIVTDSEQGALPQLQLVPAGVDTMYASGCDADVHVLALGDYLGSSKNVKGDITVTIDSPRPDANVDLAERGEVLLEGTVSANTSVKRVKVYGDGVLIGNASITMDNGEQMWSMSVSSPTSKMVKYRVVAETRGGAVAETSVAVNVHLPDAEDTVLDPDTVVLDVTNPDQRAQSVTEKSVTFAAEPNFPVGAIIVSDACEGAPEGFLRRVTAVQHEGNHWIVHTTHATLTEAIEQGKVDEVHQFTEDEIELEEVPRSEDGVEVVDEGVPSIELRAETGSQTIAEPVRMQKEETRDTNIPVVHPVAFIERNSNVRAIGRAEATIKAVASVKNEYVISKQHDAEKVTDCSKAKPETKNRLKSVDYGFTASLISELESSLGIKFILDIRLKPGFLPKGELKEFRFSLIGNLSAELASSFKAHASKEFDIASVKVMPKKAVTLWAGFVPIVITNRIDLDVSAKLSAELALDWKYSWEREFEVGVQYKNGRFSPVDEQDDSSSMDTPCSSATASASVQADLVPELSMTSKLYDCAGPSASITPTLTALGRLAYEEDKLTIEGSIKVVPTAKAAFVLEIPIVDEELAKYETPELELQSVELWSAKKVLAECSTGGSGNEPGRNDVAAAFHVVDAQSGEPVMGAWIEITPKTGNTTGQAVRVRTDQEGDAEQSLRRADSYTVKAGSDGDVEYESQETPESLGNTLRIALSKPTASVSEWRAVLTWGEAPRDVDSHLSGTVSDGSSFHVYYVDKEYMRDDGTLEAWLDVDDVDSYGPETVTFNVSDQEEYHYYLHNYSGEQELRTSNAKVEVYHGNELVKTYRIPQNLNNYYYWNVFEIKNGQLVDADTSLEFEGEEGAKV